MIENQFGKRNTSDSGRVAVALKLKPLIEQRAQERMVAGKAAPADPTHILRRYGRNSQGAGHGRRRVA